MRFSDETKEILKKVYKTWKGKTTYDRANKLYKELYGGNAELLVKCGWIYPVNDNSTGSGVADYPAMLTKGIDPVREWRRAAHGYRDAGGSQKALSPGRAPPACPRT